MSESVIKMHGLEDLGIHVGVRCYALNSYPQSSLAGASGSWQEGDAREGTRKRMGFR